MKCVLRGKRSSASHTVSDLSFIDAKGRVFAELDGLELHVLPGGDWPQSRVATAK